jgi:hypothetical protein
LFDTAATARSPAKPQPPSSPRVQQTQNPVSYKEVGFFTNNLKGTRMPSIKIDDKEYDLDTLSDEAKAQLASLQFVDNELQRLNAQAAVLQTARMAYSKALNELLGNNQPH